MKPVRRIRFDFDDLDIVSSGEARVVRHNAYYDAVRLRADVLDYKRRVMSEAAPRP